MSGKQETSGVGGVVGWGGGGELPIYGIVRMCVPNSPLFQRCQVYDWPPFFNKKYMNGPIFLDSYVKDPIFLVYFSLRDFSRLLILLVLYELTNICVITSEKKWVQKIKGQYMNRSTFWMIKYMNRSIFFEGQVYEWGRF